MKLILQILASICVMLTLIGAASAKEWRGIVPLHSTRADVERLLGPSDGKGLGIYKFKKEVVTIQYSEEPCGGGSIWNIPRDTVVNIMVAPRATQQLSDLKIDMSRYKKKEAAQGYTYYVDEEEGVTIEVNVVGTVLYVNYGPGAKDKAPRCRKV